jgi:hypothetical protein
MPKSFSGYYTLILFVLLFLYAIVSILSPELIIRLSEISNSLVGLKIDRKHSAWAPGTIRMIGFLILGLGVIFLIGIFVNIYVSTKAGI